MIHLDSCYVYEAGGPCSCALISANDPHVIAFVEYVRQVTAGERSDDFQDDEDAIIALNTAANTLLKKKTE